jgi:hypothetical protein
MEEKKKKGKTSKRKSHKPVRVVPIDDVYRLINRVQLTKKDATFSVEPCDADTVQHVIRDLELRCKRRDWKTKTTFTIGPNPEDDKIIPDVEVDFFDDEILEDGQVF